MAMISATFVARLGLTLLLLLPACDGGEPSGDAPVLVFDPGGRDIEISVEVADTPEKRQRGLMGREELPEDAGMVFLHDQPVTSGFWMKDTLIPLSVAFWDEAGTIGAILDMEPCEADPCTVYSPGISWVGAVEVNQGFFEEHGIATGTRVSLEGVSRPGDRAPSA